MPGQAKDSPNAILQNAYALCMQGNALKAEQLFLILQNISSTDATFVNQLGILAHMLGKTSLALDYLHKSIELQPAAPFYNNLGLVQEQSDDLDNAQSAYEQAIKLDPGFAPSHYNLGNVFQKREQLELAYTEYQKAIHLQPDYAKAYNNLGHVLNKMGLTYEAEVALRSCLKITPTSPDALLNLTGALYRNGKYHEALVTADKVLRNDPHNLEAHIHVCLSQHGLGDTRNAIESCRKALNQVEDKEKIYRTLGIIYASTADRQEAARYFRKALDLSPDNGVVHWNLSRLKKYDIHDEHIAEMESTYTNSADSGTRSFLCMALGKAYEDSGQFAKAFQFIDEGNRLLRETYTYNIESEIPFFRTIKSIFSPDFFNRNEGHGHENANQIFIIGMPRSGTTLVEQILASHPEVYGAGELPDLDQIIRKTLQEGKSLKYPDGMEELAPQNFTAMGQEYVNRMEKYFPGAQRITNKMPQNFLWVGLIQSILPHAKIIHCRRDPMDTCWSIYKNFFDQPHLHAQDLRELGEYYNLYLDLMQHWRDVLPGRMYEIDYEKIIESQEEETRKLLDHCGLAWDNSCLTYYQSDRQVHTSSMSQVRQPIYTSSVHKWKRFEKELQPLFEIINAEKKS